MDLIRTLIIGIGSIVALKTYIAGQRQRKLENSLKMLDLFHSNLRDEDIERWVSIFQSSSEPAGAKPKHFINAQGQQTPLSYLFSEGPEDLGATDRITDQLNLLCHHMLKGTLDISVIYSNIGQLMSTIYFWYKDGDFLKNHYPDFEKFMRKKQRSLKKIPTKTICYCE
ncbi:hypothetical protein [Photobacterium sanguinicancri]|uniref:hypothetical protein n=1 Tax=Photobacterium sanguinicancri TaxID=875932 RepID=UPI00248179D1|nr:hypothetical protein [Photobacterium sanguinicancri]